MAKKSQKPKKEKSSQDSAERMSMEELCKKFGIPYKDETAEHEGKFSINFSQQQTKEGKDKKS